jgi:trimethylamine--corrinoid protein Co-methyltransferase
VTYTDRRQVTYHLEVIDPEGVAAIRAATIEVLSDAGVVYEETEALELLSSAGAAVEKGGLARIPEALVQQCTESAPSVIRMYSREGDEAMRLEPGYSYCGTGSDCLYVLDSQTRERRQATKEDIETFARLSDALPNIDFVLSMGLASDVPRLTADLHHFQAMVCNTSKPIFFTATEHDNLVDIIDLAAYVAGGPQSLEDHPFLGLFAMPSPPLRHSRTALENLIYCARHGIPVVYASGTSMGGLGPMSISGGTVSSNCDVLSGLVVHQLANPGAPFIYGVGVSLMDMYTTIDSYGAPEHHLADVVNAQVAHSYGLPTWGYVATTDSKTLDLQAALEYFSATMMGLLSGCNLLHDVGYLESGLTASCESLLLGHEVVEYARRLLQPVDVSEEALAVSTIKRVGSGGTFLDAHHTVSHLHDFWYSRLIDRRRYSQWVNDGSQTMYDRLTEQAREILSSHQPVPLPESTLQRMNDLIGARDRRAASAASGSRRTT